MSFLSAVISEPQVCGGGVGMALLLILKAEMSLSSTVLMDHLMGHSLTDIRAVELGPPLGLGESGKESGQGRPSKLEAVAQGRSKSLKQMARGSKALPQMWV